MLFSRDDKSKTNEPKKRSLFGMLFNPNVGTEVGPLFEAGRMFVRMVAYILASYKLFPKDHPFFTDDTVRVSFADLFRISYRRLSFTREGLPQIILFVAVFGCLLFTALFVVTFVLSMLMGNAHAQEVFRAPHAESDWALKWIDYLFLGKEIELDNVMSSQPKGCEIQRAMGAALSIYSSAVLVLAGFLLMYHLVFMIAEQAHTGKLMGKAHQIWAPIRLVFAIGMLVPITANTTVGTCDGSISGYNTAQYVAAQVARWGSGLGSRVWEGFVKGLISEQVAVCKASSDSDAAEQPNSPSCIRSPNVISEIFQSMVVMEGCSYLFNYYLDQGGLKTPNAFMGRPALYVNHIDELTFAPEPGKKFKAAAAYLGLRNDGHDDWLVNYQDFLRRDGAIICGGYQIPVYSSSDYDSVIQAQYGVLKVMAQTAKKFVEDWMPYFIDGLTTNKYSDVQETMMAQYSYYKEYYQKAMDNTISTTLANADQKAQQDALNALGNPRYTQSGWLTAGTWFTTIAKVQSVRNDAVRRGMPNFVRPSIFRLSQTGMTTFGDKAMVTVPGSVTVALQKFEGAMEFNQGYPYSKTMSSDEANVYEQQSIRLGEYSTEKGDLLGKIFAKIDEILGSYTVWTSYSVLGIKFGVTSNPIAEIAAFGQNNVESGLAMMGSGAFGGAFLKLLPDSIGGPLMVIASLVTTIGTILVTIGFTLGYIVPLYPFYRFFFGSMIWAMTVFEAIVLAPLFALAHIEPHGEGLAGKRGQYGYNIALQLLLRPALMVFGLIAGYLIFKISLMFLNEAFVYATSGTGAYAGSVPVIAKIIYTIIYCALVVILANQAFSPIGLFPQTALKWLGLGGVTEERIADTGLVTAAATAGANHMTNKLAAIGSGAQKLVGSSRQAYEKSRDERLADNEKDIAKKVAGQRHSADAAQRDRMIAALSGLRGSQDPNIPPPSEPPEEEPPQTRGPTPSGPVFPGGSSDGEHIATNFGGVNGEESPANPYGTPNAGVGTGNPIGTPSHLDKPVETATDTSEETGIASNTRTEKTGGPAPNLGTDTNNQKKPKPKDDKGGGGMLT